MADLPQGVSPDLDRLLPGVLWEQWRHWWNDCCGEQLEEMEGRRKGKREGMGREAGRVRGSEGGREKGWGRGR